MATKNRQHRDSFTGEYIPEKSAKKRPARSVSEPRARRLKFISACQDATQGENADETCVITLTDSRGVEQTIDIPRKLINGEPGRNTGPIKMRVTFEYVKK